MRRIFWLACALSSSGVANADDPRLQLAPSSLEVPLQFGPLKYRGTPDTFGDPALGAGYRFNAPGMALTLYVYDAGVAGIPDGADNTPVCAEYERAKMEVTHAGYQKIVLKGDRLVRLGPPEDRPLAREASFEFEVETYPALSFLWITGAEKHFIKVRFTADARLRDDISALRRTVLDALGETIRPRLAAPDPNSKPPANSINVSFGGSQDEMTAGFLYAGLLGAIADQSPESGPVCGGEFVPDFASELSVYRSLISMREGGDKNRLLERLASIDAAGFLDEFLWIDVHRDEWGNTPPEGLEVGAYQAWRKKNLKKFKRPNFATVVINHPRPLPVEPQ